MQHIDHSLNLILPVEHEEKKHGTANRQCAYSTNEARRRDGFGEYALYHADALALVPETIHDSLRGPAVCREQSIHEQSSRGKCIWRSALYGCDTDIAFKVLNSRIQIVGGRNTAGLSIMNEELLNQTSLTGGRVNSSGTVVHNVNNRQPRILVEMSRTVERSDVDVELNWKQELESSAALRV